MFYRFLYPLRVLSITCLKQISKRQLGFYISPWSLELLFGDTFYKEVIIKLRHKL